MIHLKTAKIKLVIKPEVLTDNSIVFDVIAVQNDIEYKHTSCISHEEAKQLVKRIRDAHKKLNRELSLFEIQY